MPLPIPPGFIHVVLWCDPDCRESQRAARLLEPLPVEVTRVSLADRPPTVALIREAAAKLGTHVGALARRDQPRFAELDLESADDETLLLAMARHPELIQRPLVIVGDRAVIARPAELLYRVIAPVAPADGGRQAIRDMLQGRAGSEPTRD